MNIIIKKKLYLLLLLIPLFLFLPKQEAKAEDSFSGWYTITTKEAPSYRLGIDKTIKIQPTSNSTGQKFLITPLGNNLYSIGTGTTAGRHVLGDSITAYSKKTNQQWQIIKNSDNTYSFKNKSDGKNLGYTGNVSKKPSITRQKADTNNVKQKFLIQPVNNKCTVTFTNESGKAIKRETIIKGKAATAPTVPAKKGYNAKWDTNTSKITKNTTVKPVYTAINYTITYNLNGGKASNPATYKVTDEIKLEEPTKEGKYHFLGWSEESDRIYIAHRGYSNTAPENTMSAFKEAVNRGYEYIETDVRFTKDGVPVLLHDATINRTAKTADGKDITENKNIADLDYAEAIKYDYGITKNEVFKGEKLPTLEEYIKLCKENNVRPFIEIKSCNTKEKMKKIFDIVKKYGLQDKAIFGSFYNVNNLIWLDTLNEIYPKATTALFVAAQENFDTTIKKAGEKKVNIISAEYNLLTEENLNKLSAYKVMTWTVDDAKKINALKSQIKGVCTNSVQPAYKKEIKISKGTTGNKTYTAHFRRGVLVHFKHNGADNSERSKGDVFVSEIKQVSGLQNSILWQKDGYICSSWNTKANGTGKKYTFRYKDKDKYNMDDFEEKEVTLYAQYSPAYVRIRYNMNGATSDKLDDVYIKSNATYEIPTTTPTKTGYNFTGWKYQDGSVKKAGNKITKYPNNTIHAKDDFVLNTGITETAHFHPQGMTVVKEGNVNYLYAVMNRDNGYDYLCKFNLNEKKLIKKVQVNFGHVNDIVYNPVDKTFYTTCGYKFDKNLNQLGNYKRLKNGKSVGAGNIVYYNNHFVTTGNVYHVYDSKWTHIHDGNSVNSDFEDLNNSSGAGGQGATERDGLVYSGGFVGSGTNNFVTLTDIEGTNILKNTDNAANKDWDKGGWAVGSYGDGTGSTRKVTDSPETSTTAFAIKNNTTGNKDWVQRKLPLEKGVEYTLSGWVRVPSGGKSTMLLRLYDNKQAKEVFKKTQTVSGTEWQRYSYTTTFNGTKGDTNYQIGLTGKGDIEVLGMRLTRGKINQVYNSYFFAYHVDVSNKEAQREIEDIYVDKDKTYVFCATATNATSDSNIHVQVLNGDGIPTNTLTAQWSPKTVNVTFNKNFGDNATYKETYTYAKSGQSFGMNLKDKSGSFGTWKRAGYTLLGWSFNKSATKADYSIYSGVSNNWIDTNAGNKSLYAIWKVNATVKPEDFGAKGDGKTDDTAAIQKAVDSGATNINFTKTYYVAGAIKINKDNINCYGGGTFKVPNTGNNMIQVHGKKTKFTNLNFTGSGGGSGACIWFHTNSSDANGTYRFDSVVQNCTFTNTGKRGVDVMTANHNKGKSTNWPLGEANTGNIPRAGFITITKCTFTKIQNIALCTAGATNLTITDNTFTDSKLEHITLDWSTRNSSVTGNKFNGSTGGCGVIGVDTAWDCVIKNNTFSTTKKYSDNKRHVRINDETGKSKNIQVQKNAEASSKYAGTWKAV